MSLLNLEQSCISKLLNEWGCGTLAKDDYVHEICRYGGAELHSVSSFIGELNIHSLFSVPSPILGTVEFIDCWLFQVAVLLKK